MHVHIPKETKLYDVLEYPGILRFFANTSSGHHLPIYDIDVKPIKFDCLRSIKTYKNMIIYFILFFEI